MRKAAPKKIKNSTLMVLFFLLVFLSIVVSIIAKTIYLIAHSTVDSRHQFILEIKQQKSLQLIVFNRSSNSINVVTIQNVKNTQDVQSLQVPIDGTYQQPDGTKINVLSSELFTMIFGCSNTACQNLNRVDALKLYLFSTHVRPSDIQTTSIGLPVSQNDLKTTIPALFMDDTLYHEALSISVINASGEVGLGNEASQLLTDIGGNVLSVTSADTQATTTMQSTYGKNSYSIQRIQKILHLSSQKMQNAGISDIIIIIGKKHPQL